MGKKNFELNYQRLYEVDITPNASTRKWARLAAGLTGADPSNNEEIDQTGYLDGDGYKESEVTGAQFTIGFSGNRVVGDAAQDFIASVEHELGDNRKTSFRVTDKFGNKKTGSCTICNVDMGGGDAGAKVECSFEIHCAGKPELTDKTVASALTAVIAAGSVSGTTKFTATADIGNSLKYKLLASAPDAVFGYSYLENAKSYSSGSDIAAAVGQYLCMYEVSEYGRVVKFLGATLATADIKA
jgi:hypothetical protein